MDIKFSKYHGLGNDFILVDYLGPNFAYENLAVNVCNRNTGIGADGLIIVRKDPLTMIFYNQDGSLGTMCGNGLRCFSKYARTQNIISRDEFVVATASGDYNVKIQKDLVKVEFINISFEPKLMDINTNMDKFLNQKVLNSICYAVHTGTSHLVVYVDEFDSLTCEYAKTLHEHPIFKSKINVNFVKVLDRDNLEIKTYERGVGFTLACGTGSIASFTISRMLNLVNSKVTVNYKVGQLILEEDKNSTYFTGPAKIIAQGIYFI